MRHHAFRNVGNQSDIKTIPPASGMNRRGGRIPTMTKIYDYLENESIQLEQDGTIPGYIMESYNEYKEDKV